MVLGKKEETARRPINLATTTFILLCLGSISSALAIDEKRKTSDLSAALVDAQRSAKIQKFCQEQRNSFKELKWSIDPCDGAEWQIGGTSVKSRPLVYAEFGNPQSKNSTLIVSMVHGDEITPMYLSAQIAKWLKDNKDLLADAHVILAPLVNPDSFLHKPRSRTNSRGVDVNRNFGTKDWDRLAKQAWKKRYGANPRRFPGNAPDSEPETRFQKELIDKFQPQKVLAIHAPLNFLDYDGPNMLSLHKFPKEYVAECLRLRQAIKAEHSHYYPGSLGNYAGRERGIPTITLELPSADPRKGDKFWQEFKPGLRTMIDYKVQPAGG